MKNLHRTWSRKPRLVGVIRKNLLDVKHVYNTNNASYTRDLGFGSPVDHGRHVMSSRPVPLKTRRVGQRCTLNLSRAETSSRWCGVVVRRGGVSSGVVHVT
ncbi:uncharacterized protein TNCV_3062901 [Trichonephila clavipes]|nr:uncharacterized protein TNCV_3062901 [Trichonephila clavipes]